MKVITFSRNFPVSHPRKGEPTFFQEKIWVSLGINKEKMVETCFQEPPPKHHTIRGGNRWKVGDWFSPRVWSGKPYASKQIEFAPPIQIKKVWDFMMDEHGYYFIDGRNEGFDIEEVAKNDGLTISDFDKWFHSPRGKVFKGQIICWNGNISY